MARVADKQTILLVEDDKDYAEARKIDFELEGYSVEIVSDGHTAFSRAQKKRFNIIVLDVGLRAVEPPMDGFQLCRALRKENNKTPILLLTGRTDSEDIVFGLKCGGDDYVTKDAPKAVLLARVSAVLRRATMNVHPEPLVYSFANIELDHYRREVRRNGEPIPFTEVEFKLLLMFVQNPGLGYTRDHILDKGHVSGGASAVDVHILNLRRKIERDSQKPVHLITIHGFGFRFDAKVTKKAI